MHVQGHKVAMEIRPLMIIHVVVSQQAVMVTGQTHQIVIPVICPVVKTIHPITVHVLAITTLEPVLIHQRVDQGQF